MPDQTENQYGPFTSSLLGPLTPKAEQIPQPTGYGGHAAALAQFASAFIRGAQQGQRTKYERSEQQKAEQDRNFDSVMAHIQADPTISQEGKDAAQKQYLTAKYSRVNEDLKGAHKDHKDNPIVGLAKSITGAVLGPDADKKHKDLGIDVNSLLSIATSPQYKINPQEIGSLENALKPTQAVPQSGQSPASGQSPQVGPKQPPQTGFNLSGAPTAAPLQASPQTGPTNAAAQVSPATPPPPGTTAAAASAPKGGVPWASQQEALADPNFVAAMGKINKAGIPFASTELGQVFGTLPKAGQPKPFGAKYEAKDANGVLHTYQDVVDSTGAISKVDHGESKTPTPAKPSSTAEQHQQRIDARMTLGASREDAEKEEAKYELQAADKKIAIKPDAADKIAKSYLDSGKASSPEEAKKMAAEFQVKLGDAQLKAKQRVPGSGGGAGGKPTMLADDLDTLADAQIAGLGTPQFGRGANDPNRLAYQVSMAHRITDHGGIGGALALRADAKSLQSQLTKLMTLEKPIEALSNSANEQIDAAVEASKNWPRDSSSLVNGWDQWLTKGSVDDQKLQDFIVKTETAANEYAKVIGNTTGASTDAARKQANDFIRTQLADKSYDAAANAMKSDMTRRIDGFYETIQGVKDSIKNIGKKESTTPPPTQSALPSFTNKAGLKVEVGKPVRDPKSGKYYIITSIDKDGMIHTADTPIQ